MRVILTDRRGATVWTGDVQAVGLALDLYAQSLGYADDEARWEAEGPFRGRIFAHTGLQLQEIDHATL